MRLSRFNKEKVFPIPDIRRAQEREIEPPAIRRHYLVIRDAMIARDTKTIGSRQLRLLAGGFEVPVTLQQCNKLLEKYEDVT